MMMLLVGVVAGRRVSTYPLVVVRYFVVMLCGIHGCPVCVIGDVFDDSLVENGQQTSYGPCCLGTGDRDGAEEVCVAACGCSGACDCACLSAHDALAAVYAAERTCTGSCGESSVGVASRVRVPDQEQHTLG